MSKDAIKRVAALGAVVALAAAPAALANQPADPGSNGRGHVNQAIDTGQSTVQHGQSGLHGKAGQHGQAGLHGKKGGDVVVSYVFKGVYAGDGSVDVKSGNNHVRQANLVDSTVAFDLTNASIVADDNTADGSVAADDVNPGDKVVVKTRLPRKTPGDQPFAATQLVDQTHLQPTS
jgi:hypothetical protein